MDSSVCVFLGPELEAYNFGADHPFGPGRYGAFVAELHRLGLGGHCRIREPVAASREALGRFHTEQYIDHVRAQSVRGTGFLDCGDTPAFAGVYEAAATVVGTTLAALDTVMAGTCRRAFTPIAGLHHARRDQAAGFCVFNDCGVAIATARSRYGLQRIAYVDIDAHHGDGVFYAFEDDPDVWIADLHEDGRFLYPGTGFAEETGKGAAHGTKLNLPMPPQADDTRFRAAWGAVEELLDRARPELILFQCGADSVAGDPITDLAYTPAAHAYAAERLCHLSDRHCQGRLVALGGGGYKLDNVARAWCAVVEALFAGGEKL